MIKRFHTCLVALAVFSLALAVSNNAVAQGTTGDGPATKSPTPSNTLPPAKTKDGKPGPATVDERDRILGDLYKRLSEAKDPDYAKLVETAIQKMWVFSGSDTVDLLMTRIRVAVSKEKSQVAMSLLNAVVGLEPAYAEGWNRRAFIHFSNKDYGAALKDLRRVLVIDPKHYKAIGGLAVILREYGQDEAALKAFRKALEIHPHDPETAKAVKELEITVEGQKI